MKTVIFGAGSDLGVHIDGSHLGPLQLINDVKGFFNGEIVNFIQEDVIKSRNLSDKRKNFYELDKFNKNLYNSILEKISEDKFPVVVGGDHSVAIASALASQKRYENIGIIWFDSHSDYNTFKTTVTGNIHGLPLAAINGIKDTEDLSEFFDGSEYINTMKTVIVGARSIDEWEKDNLKYSNVTVFTTDDIKREGIDVICDKAFEIAGARTNGIHVSYDLDLLDPEIAPGVSIPEFDGLSAEDGLKICDSIDKYIEKIVSFDLVEFNPLRDIDRKTEQIAVNILAKVLNSVNKK